VQRIRGCMEKRATKKKVRCKRCGGLGHFQKSCKEPEVGQDGERGPCRNHFCRKRTIEDDAGTSQPQVNKKKKKKTTTAKKKTPVKKKLKRAKANPPPTVVTSITKLVFDP